MVAAYSGCSSELQTIPDYKMLEDATECAELSVLEFLQCLRRDTCPNRS